MTIFIVGGRRRRLSLSSLPLLCHKAENGWMMDMFASGGKNSPNECGNRLRESILMDLRCIVRSLRRREGASQKAYP